MRQLPPQSKPTFGFTNSPFGECCIVFSNDGICALTFPEDHNSALYDIEQRFPETDFDQDDAKAAKLAEIVFAKRELPRLNPIGTEFQQAVWAALCGSGFDRVRKVDCCCCYPSRSPRPQGN